MYRAKKYIAQKLAKALKYKEKDIYKYKELIKMKIRSNKKICSSKKDRILRKNNHQGYLIAKSSISNFNIVFGGISSPQPASP